MKIKQKKKELEIGQKIYIIKEYKNNDNITVSKLNGTTKYGILTLKVEGFDADEIYCSNKVNPDIEFILEKNDEYFFEFIDAEHKIKQLESNQNNQQAQSDEQKEKLKEAEDKITKTITDALGMYTNILTNLEEHLTKNLSEKQLETLAEYGDSETFTNLFEQLIKGMSNENSTKTKE